MSLITKDHLSLTLKALKKLLSFKADKTEVVLKDDVKEVDAIELAMKTGLITSDIPVSEDNSIYTDNDGKVYIL